MLYDITRTVSAKTAVFPGDTPYSARLNWRISAGARRHRQQAHGRNHA